MVIHSCGYFYGFFFHLRFILKFSQQCMQAIIILHYLNWMVWSSTSINPNWFAVRFSWRYLDHFERFPFDRVSDGLDSYNVRVGLGQVVQVAVDVVYFVIVLPSHTMPWIIVVNDVISRNIHRGHWIVLFVKCVQIIVKYEIFVG